LDHIKFYRRRRTDPIVQHRSTQGRRIVEAATIDRSDRAAARQLRRRRSGIATRRASPIVTRRHRRIDRIDRRRTSEASRQRGHQRTREETEGRRDGKNAAEGGSIDSRSPTPNSRLTAATRALRCGSLLFQIHRLRNEDGFLVGFLLQCVLSNGVESLFHVECFLR